MTRHTINGPLADVTFEVDDEDLGGGAADVPVVWLHGVFGALGAAPFREDLGRGRLVTVHHLGFGQSIGVERFFDIRDLATAYWWLLDRLEVGRALLVGHSFGATLAAELAVQQPGRVAGLVLVAPFGLFRADEPGLDVFGTIQRDLMPALYAAPAGELAAGHFPSADDAHGRGLQALERVQVLSSASRFLFPIPDTGIGERLYRLADVPVELLWGERDGLVPVALSDDWLAGLPRARSSVVPGTAHMLPYEAPSAVAEAITALQGAGVGSE